MTFLPDSSSTEKCRWKPLPPSSDHGLPRKVACLPVRATMSLTAVFSRNVRSAASSASLCHRLISYCDGLNSWLPANTPMSMPSSMRSRCSRVPSGSTIEPVV
jgi:hypothetical protein